MTKPRKAYPTDLNDTEYALIAPYLPKKKTRRGSPRIIPWREILNGIFYITRNGCSWSALPHDLPKCKTVYHYYRQFRLLGLWETINQHIREAVREQAGRKAQASAMILDSQSVKSAEGGEGRGFDGGKKVNGRKRNIIVDTQGLLVLTKVTPANVQDVHAGKQVLQALQERPHLLERLQTIFADGGYRGDLVAWVKEQLHVDLTIVLRSDPHKGFQVLPRRWVVERSIAWIGSNRRLARDYERLAASSEAFIYIAMIRLGLRRLSLF